MRQQELVSFVDIKKLSRCPFRTRDIAAIQSVFGRCRISFPRVFGFSEIKGPKVGSPSSQQQPQYCTVHPTERYRGGVHVGLLRSFAVAMEDKGVDMEEMTNEEYGWEGSEGVVGWSGSEFWRISRQMISDRRRSCDQLQ